MALIDVNWKPGSRELRQFAGMFLVFGLTAGTLIYYFKDWPLLVSQVLWGAAVVIGVLGLIVPKLALPVYVVMMAVALPIGMVVSTVLMTLIFFVVITPIGLMMRLVGKDSMHKSFDPNATTYWIRRPPQVPAARYFKQY